MKRFLVLSVMLVMFSATGITVSANSLGENEQSADVITRLKENISGEQKELITELMKSSDEVIEFIRQKIESGELETEDDIEEAIEEGEEKFDVSLTEEDKEKILQVVQKAEELGIDPEKFLDQAQDMCEEFGDELADTAKEAVKQSVESSVTGFFQDMGKRIKGFFSGIFS